VALERKINRLIVLSELFDSELESAREAILSLPGYEEARILDHLERTYYTLTAERFDRELSLLIISQLKSLAGDVEAYGAALDEFSESHRVQLEKVFEEYSSDAIAHPFMTQPEATMIFLELEKDRFSLANAWPYDISLLEPMANAWGTTVVN
jgi:hypothetical protein